jgi:hypothetical protein
LSLNFILLFFRRLHPAAASALKTPEEQHSFMDPAAKVVRQLQAWKEHRGYLTAMLRTPLLCTSVPCSPTWIFRIAMCDRKELRRELFNLARSSMKGRRA